MFPKNNPVTRLFSLMNNNVGKRGLSGCVWRSLPAVLTLLFLIFAAEAAAQIPITSIEDLQKIGNDPSYPLDGEYVLTQDIDASATAIWNDGAGFAPVGTASSRFTGVFDGAGYVISGLFINRPAEDFVGLFGVVGAGGEIRNVGLESADVTGAVVVGGLVGGLDSGTVAYCYATGDVEGVAQVGGLVGLNSQGAIEPCYAAVKVTSTSSDTSAAGGLVGFNSQGAIESCYATGEVTGSG